MSERALLKIAKHVSYAFPPFCMTFVVFAAVLLGGARFMLSAGFVPTVLGYVILLLIVFCLTVVTPYVSVGIYRRLMHMSVLEADRRSNRNVPFVLTILCYLGCVLMLHILGVPSFLRTVVVAALVVQILCAIINLWWKISVHMAALGGVVAVVAVYGFVARFNPLPLMCVLFFISGLVGSSRMVLRQNSLSQVMWGFVLGAGCVTYFVFRSLLRFMI